MIHLKITREHRIDTMFILALLVLFAITSFLVVAIGAKQYQSIVEHMTDNHEIRTVSSYLHDKMNQHDTSDSVTICTVGDSEALQLAQEIDNQIYHTYIYAYDGYLWETTVTSLTAVVPGNGKKIIEIGNLTMEVFPGNLFCFTITNTTGSSYPLYVSFNAN